MSSCQKYAIIPKISKIRDKFGKFGRFSSRMTWNDKLVYKHFVINNWEKTRISLKSAPYITFDSFLDPVIAVKMYTFQTMRTLQKNVLCRNNIKGHLQNQLQNFHQNQKSQTSKRGHKPWSLSESSVNAKHKYAI